LNATLNKRRLSNCGSILAVLRILGFRIPKHKIMIMKSSFLLLVATTAMLIASGQEDKSKRPSPPAFVKETLANGTVVSIDYSQPSVRGRTIGKNLEPIDSQVWRTGANEATVFEVSKNVKVEGKELPAGKYALFTISGKDTWTIIFNKTWKQLGAFNYNKAEDALRVTVKAGRAKDFTEKMTFTISPKGKVTLLWGDLQIEFNVQ
jgi:hypothetical protein